MAKDLVVRFLVTLSLADRAILADSTCASLSSTFDATIDGQTDGGGILWVKKKGHDAFSMVRGVLHKGSSTSMTDNTLIEIASVTKTFVAALVLKKKVEGEIQLSDTAQSILGADLPAGLLEVNSVDKTADITLEQLLQHRSGLSHFWNAEPMKSVETWYTELGLTAPTSNSMWNTLKSSMANRWMFEGISIPYFTQDTNPSAMTKVWKPSEVLNISTHLDSLSVGDYKYSDTNYVILGLVVEKLYSVSLSDAIRDNLMRPVLGTSAEETHAYMRYNPDDASDRSPSNSDKYARLSHRYFHAHELGGLGADGRYDTTMSDSGQFPVNGIISSYYNSADWGSGGLVTTAPELGLFWEKLMTATEAPWKAVKEELTVTSDDTGYGMGVRKESQLLGHSGDGGGSMWWHATDEVTVSGTNNNNNNSMTEFIKANWDHIVACAGEQGASEPTTTSTTSASESTSKTTGTGSVSYGRLRTSLALAKMTTFFALALLCAQLSD